MRVFAVGIGSALPSDAAKEFLFPSMMQARWNAISGEGRRAEDFAAAFVSETMAGRGGLDDKGAILARDENRVPTNNRRRSGTEPA